MRNADSKKRGEGIVVLFETMTQRRRANVAGLVYKYKGCAHSVRLMQSSLLVHLDADRLFRSILEEAVKVR